MTRKVLVVTEGPHDEALIGRIAKQCLGFVDQRKKSEVDTYWDKTIPTSFPRNDDLRMRMAVPAFYWNSQAQVSLAIVFGGGEAEIAQQALDTMVVLPKQVDALGIVVDADGGQVAQRFATVKADLTAAGLPSPLQAGAIIAGPPKCGVYVLPDNATHGTLEDVLLDCASARYPTVLQAAEQLVAAVAGMGLSAVELKPFNKPAGPKKTKVGAIGSILKPGASSQVTIANDDWICTATLQLPRVAGFVSFLQQLVS